MIQTIDFSKFCDAFEKFNYNDQFSYKAKKALFEYFEQEEEDGQEQIELDIVAICCEYKEEHWSTIAENYESFADFLANNHLKDDYQKEDVVNFLTENTAYVGEGEDDNLVYQKKF